MAKFKGSAPVVLSPHPAILYAADVCDRVVRSIAGLQPIFTGGQEEGHSEKSLHYGIPGDTRCRALDIRISGFNPTQLKMIVGALQARLPALEFDVVLEPDHIHLEYDPKV